MSSTNDVEPQVPTNGTEEDNLSFDSNQISSEEQLSQIIDSINLLPATEGEEIPNTEVSEPSVESKPPTTTLPRTAGHTPIGAKLVKKIETFAASTKENKQSNGSTPSTINVPPVSAAASVTANSNNNESDSRRIITKAAKNIMKNLTDPDPQKNLAALAVKLAEMQEQQRLTVGKVSELEKRSTVIMRERDQALLENGRITAAKAKLESLCRELHRHNQQIRDESIQRQREDETKRRELATKFQTTIDEIAAQLSNYSEKSTSLREQNVQLSEQLSVVVKDYELREKEVEMALKKKELELRLTEASLEQSHALLNERTELIKQERQVSEAERLVLYKKCEELAASELGLRSQVTIYSERYQEFQSAIQQSSQMVTSCHTEIEKMGKKIKKLEKERGEFRQRWETAEQNQRKASEDVKLIDKEKRQLETKLDKLDKLCRVLQQERSDLQGTIKSLTKSTTNPSSVSTPIADSSVTPTISDSSETTVNGHETNKTDSVLSTTSESPNLYDGELGRMAKTVD